MTATIDTQTRVPVASVRAGNNDRKTFDQRKLEELAASIAAVGLLQPPTVRPTGDGYELVAGERRFRAVQLLGWTDLPVIFQPDGDDRQASMAMLVENVQRADLDAMEEAEAYRSRLDQFAMTVEELAEAVGVAPFRIRWRLELLKLNDDVAQLVRSGAFPTGFARLMAPLDTNRQALAFAAYRDTPRMTCDQFGALCERLALEQASDSMFDDDAFLRVDEYVLDAQTGTAKATRAALLDALGDTLALIGETLGDDSLTETEAARVARARRLLEMAR